MRRAGLLLVGASLGVAAGSLFLDSSEFSSEDAEPGGDAGADATIGVTNDATLPDGAAADAGTDVDGGDDFCSRSFATAPFNLTFDETAEKGWTTIECTPGTGYGIQPDDGTPPPSMSFAPDSPVSRGASAVCGAEKIVAVGHTNRFGFDVRVGAGGAKLAGVIHVGRMHLTMPDGSDYGFHLYHGIASTTVDHRFGLAGGGEVFQVDPPVGNATTAWVKYRGEVAIVPGGTSTYRLCRDGQQVYGGALTKPLAVPTGAFFGIGILYVRENQTAPMDLRFDNVFVEVAP
jgi:hypothetical protein